MTSPLLTKPKRTEAEAQWDYEHRRLTDEIGSLRSWLAGESPRPESWWKWDNTLRNALERLHNEAAERIKVRK